MNLEPSVVQPNRHFDDEFVIRLQQAARLHNEVKRRALHSSAGRVLDVEHGVIACPVRLCGAFRGGGLQPEERTCELPRLNLANRPDQPISVDPLYADAIARRWRKGDRLQDGLR